MSDYVVSTLSDLTGRVAVVTGGGIGMGLMIASGLAANGAKVYITGRRLNVLEEASELKILGAKHKRIPLQADVTDHASVANAVLTVEKNEGKLDILVNNAGVTGFDGSIETALGRETPSDSYDNWTNVFKTNVSAHYFVTNVFVPPLAKGAANTETASVIKITSMGGIAHLEQHLPAYVVSKAAAEYLARMLATKYLLEGIRIRVNTIALGTYASDMMSEAEWVHKYITSLKPGQVGSYGLPRAGT